MNTYIYVFMVNNMANRMNGWVIFALLHFLRFRTVLCNCEAASGPAGGLECVQLNDYTSYQWATCLTDTYIKTKSKGRHLCKDQSRTYCYYQCMIETFNEEDGQVYDTCACGPDAPSTLLPMVTSDEGLPQECLSPSGADCSWYLNCLEKRYPCKEQGRDSYAVEFADKFCNLFQNNRHSFTANGQRWIDAARKCLQVALAPLLRPYASFTCAEIEQTAFASHSPCYLHPYKNEPSICDLSPADWLHVFWTIKESFITRAVIDSLLGVWDVTNGCAPSVTKRLGKSMKSIVLQAVHSLDSAIDGIWNAIGKRSADFDHDAVAKQIVADVSGTMRWKDKGISWFGFVGEANATSVSVHILLTDRKSHDLNAPSSTPSADLNKTVQELSDAANGSFSFNIGSNVKVSKLYGCADLECTTVAFEETVVEAKAKQDNAATMLTQSALLIVLALCLMRIIFI